MYLKHCYLSSHWGFTCTWLIRCNEACILAVAGCLVVFSFAFSCSIHPLLMCISTRYNEALCNSSNPLFALEEVISWREVVAAVSSELLHSFSQSVSHPFSLRVCIFIFSLNLTVSFFSFALWYLYMLLPSKGGKHEFLSFFERILIDLSPLTLRSTRFAVQ